VVEAVVFPLEVTMGESPADSSVLFLPFLPPAFFTCFCRLEEVGVVVPAPAAPELVSSVDSGFWCGCCGEGSCGCWAEIRGGGGTMITPVAGIPIALFPVLVQGVKGGIGGSCC
jgi:hypothetical protein